MCIPIIPSNLKVQAGGMEMVSLNYVMSPNMNKKQEICDNLASDDNKQNNYTNAEKV